MTRPSAPATAIFSALLLAGVGAPARAQNLAADLDSMTRSLRRLDPYTVTVTVTVSDSTGAAILGRRIVAHRSRDRWLYSVDSLTVLTTPQATIVVNAARRTIAYTRVDDWARPTAPAAVPSPDSLLRGVDSVVFHGVDRAGKRYTVHSQRGPIVASEILLHRAGLLPLEVQYRYGPDDSDAARVVVRYEWSERLLADRAALDEHSYVVRGGDALRPADAYRGYAVVRLPSDD